VKFNIKKAQLFFFLNLLYEKGREEEVLNAGVKGHHCENFFGRNI